MATIARAAPTATTAPRWRSRAPATISTAKAMAQSTTAVPMSGSIRIRAPSAAVTSRKGTRPQGLLSRRGSRTMAWASHRARASLASSDGWSCPIGPRSIQRREPLTCIPMDGTSTTSSRKAATASAGGPSRRMPSGLMRAKTAYAASPATA